MNRNNILKNLSDEELIEIAFAVNSDHPFLSELTDRITKEVYASDSPNLVQCIGLGAIVAQELAFRIKNDLMLDYAKIK